MSARLYIMVKAYLGDDIDDAKQAMDALAKRIGIDVRCKMNGYEYVASPEIGVPVDRFKNPNP